MISIPLATVSGTRYVVNPAHVVCAYITPMTPSVEAPGAVTRLVVRYVDGHESTLESTALESVITGYFACR